MTTNYLLLSPYFLALFISVGVTVYVFLHRNAKGAFPFLVFSLSEIFYVGGFLLETLSPELPQKIFWDNVQWFPATIIPGANLVFIYAMVGFRKQETQKTIVWVSIAPVVFFILVILDPWLKLIRPSAELLTENGMTSLYYPFTPIVYLYAIYVNALLIYTVAILVRQLISTTTFVSRPQIAGLLASQLTIMLGTVLVIFELLPKYLRDVNPLATGIANVILAVGIYRTRIFNVVPIAKELVIETMETAIIVLDSQDCVVDINASALKILNRTDKEVIGLPFKDVFAVFSEFLEVYGSQTSVEDTITLEYQGRKNYFNLNIAPIHEKRGETVGRLISFNNITSRVELENKLQDQASQLTAANQLLQTEKMKIEQVVDEVATLRRLSDFLQSSMTVEEAGEVVASHMKSLFTKTSGGLYLIHDGFIELSLMSSWGDFSTETIIHPNDCWGMRRGRMFIRYSSDTSPACVHFGDEKPDESLCLPLMGQNEIIGMLCLQISKSEEKYFTQDVQNLAIACADSIALAIANLRLRERLRNQTIRDPLTSIFNRRFMEETLEREVHRAGRNEEPLCVIMFEIDDFKQYNNTFGHDAGDYVLKKVTDTIRSRLRRSDFPCRYGGDEFTLLLPNTTLEDGAQRAEELRKAVEALALSFNNQALGQVTVRMGVAVYPKHGETGETLLKVADDASYRARAIGKNCVVVAE